MTFENIQTSRVIKAVALTFVGAFIFLFVSPLVLMVFRPDQTQDMVDEVQDLWPLVTDPDAEQADREADLENFVETFSTELNIQYVVQWSLTALVTVVTGRWAARRAYAPDQAVGYGVAVGSGVMLTYGTLCVMCSPALVGLRLLFFGAFVFAGATGGWLASKNLDETQQPPAKAPSPGFGPFGPTSSRQSGMPLPGMPPAGLHAPEVYYNMGVAAALGGRRDEARQHFTHVLQVAPRHVPAWLQLANLADTPEQAWEYIQQARSINPADPAVLQAVSVIWPQVAAGAVTNAEASTAQAEEKPAPDDRDVSPGAADAEDESPDLDERESHL